MSKDPKKLKELTDDIVDAAFTVHRELGPGLLESAYEACLAYEFELRGRKVERQKVMPVIFKSMKIDCGYRVDMIVDGEVLVELKAVEEVHPIYKAQLLTYMQLGKFEVGYLMNFNVKLFKDGITRYKL
ncbi:MAG: GxxExxY protein [Desulfohalobiaceae bacterium]|nr:GxxExxY protein [Desulfohalobiaceae bacterium]